MAAERESDQRGARAPSRGRPARRLPAAGGQSAGPGDLYDALLAGLGSTTNWPVLGEALAEAAHGNGTEVATMAGRYETGGSSNGAEAELAIDCLDHPVDRDAADYPALAAHAAASAPVFGPLLTWGLLACAEWPVLPTRSPMPASDPGAPPILVTGATGDPATPYQWAVNLAAELDHGVLVTWVGDSHVAYYYSGCVRAIDQAYLVDGSLPAPGTGAPIERRGPVDQCSNPRSSGLVVARRLLGETGRRLGARPIRTDLRESRPRCFPTAAGARA